MFNREKMISRPYDKSKPILFIFYDYHSVTINKGAFSDFLKKKICSLIMSTLKENGNDKREVIETAAVPGWSVHNSPLWFDWQ